MATPAWAGVSPAERALVHSVNDARRAAGVGPLRQSPKLARSAGQYSSWMMRNGYFGHQPQIRMSQTFGTRAETLRLVYGSRLNAAQTVDLWLGSASHRAAILHPAVRYAGAGIVKGRFRGRPALLITLHLGGR